MHDAPEPYGREDLDAVQERLEAVTAALDALDAVLESAAEVADRVKDTDSQRDPLRDISLIPDMSEAWFSADELEKSLLEFREARERRLTAVGGLRQALENSAEAFDANAADAQAEHEGRVAP